MNDISPQSSQQDKSKTNAVQSSSLSISAEELKNKLDTDEPLMVFDIGDQQRYNKQHIPGSSYAVCNEESKKKIMPKLPKSIEIVLVAEDEQYTKNMAEMMKQMGLDVKYLEQGINGWKGNFEGQDFITESSNDISALELKEVFDESKNANDDLFLLDVREPSEFEEWHIDNSINIPLGELVKQENLSKIPKDKKIITICPHGNRSTIAKYLLERYDYDVKVLLGGLLSWSTEVEQADEDFEINGSNVKLTQIRRIGKGCMSYMLQSEDQIAVIDPVFPTDNYLNIAKEKLNGKITCVIDTHQHADHISAARSLAQKAGATLFQSSYENYQDDKTSNVDNQSHNPFKLKRMADGDTQKIGSILLKLIHSPGHTPGSFIINVENKLLFTGDTLFVDSIGRPDLRDKATEYAESLYNTIQQKLMKLPEDILILPGHFENDKKRDQILTSSLGEVRKQSHILKSNMTKEEFIKKISSIVMQTPPNYKEIIAINKGEAPSKNTLAETFDLEMGPNRCSVSM